METTKEDIKMKDKRAYLPVLGRRCPYSKTNGEVDFPIRNYRLVRARIEKGLKGKELAEAVGINFSLMYQYEGLNAYPPRETREKICRVLEKDEKDLFPLKLRDYRYENYKLKQDFFNNANRVGFRQDFSVDMLPGLGLEKEDTSRIVREIIEKLPERKKFIIEMSFGFLDGRSYSDTEIGRAIGITKEGVRQHKASAMKSLYFLLKECQEFREPLKN
jgi:transcriptional regulator with XRE-family HTH domain